MRRWGQEVLRGEAVDVTLTVALAVTAMARRFTEDEARFFIGCCVLGLKFMHGRGILHRCAYICVCVRVCARADTHTCVFAHANLPPHLCSMTLRSLTWTHPLHMSAPRDLKPSNLLVADNRYVKLGDLGLCKVRREGAERDHVLQQLGVQESRVGLRNWVRRWFICRPQALGPIRDH